MDYSALLIPVITLIITQIIIMDLALFRFGYKRLFAILSIEITIQVAVNGSLLMLAGIDIYAKWYFITMCIPVFLTFLYISKRRDLRDLFTILTTIFINFCISIPSMWISNLNGNNYLWYNCARIMIFAVVFFLIHKFFRLRYLQVQDEVEKGWGVFCILPGIGTFVLYYEYWMYSMNGNFKEALLVSTLTIIIMVNVFIVFYYVFNKLHEKYIVEEQKRILSLQNKAQWERFVQQKEAAEKTNRRWHDLRHNTEELIGLLEAGDTHTALIYLKEQRGMEEVPKDEYCLHTAVNSILCLWAERARKKGILVEIKTDVPEKLVIQPMELSALIANAFENAYNACILLPEEVQRYIKVEAKYNDKRLAIGFTNTCKEDIRFDGDLPVSQKEGGGIGTRSILYTVKRFHGVACFEVKDGVFSARFVINV